jgi:protoheme ferro-lyase
MPAIDAVLWIAFGGPERMEDVRPFLDNVFPPPSRPRLPRTGDLPQRPLF